jgi:hypothetical protein
MSQRFLDFARNDKKDFGEDLRGTLANRKLRPADVTKLLPGFACHDGVGRNRMSNASFDARDPGIMTNAQFCLQHFFMPSHDYPNSIIR